MLRQQRSFSRMQAVLMGHNRLLPGVACNFSMCPMLLYLVFLLQVLMFTPILRCMDGDQAVLEQQGRKADGGKQPALRQGSNAEGKRPAVEDDVRQAGTPVKKRSRSSTDTDLLAASSDAAELERGGPVPR